MEITSTRLDLLYKLVPEVAVAYKFKLSEPNKVLEDITFNNIHNMEQQFIDDIINAPMYTHSCNRYFNSCSFLPFCAADDIEEKELILTEMEDAEWSPLN